MTTDVPVHSALTDEELWSVARLGFILYSRERMGEARAIFEGITALSPGHGYAWFALGLIARAGGDVRRAGDYFAHALSLDPSLVDCRVALAESLLLSGDQRSACEALQPLVEEVAEEGAAQRGRVLLRRWLTDRR